MAAEHGSHRRRKSVAGRSRPPVLSLQSKEEEKAPAVLGMGG